MDREKFILPLSSHIFNFVEHLDSAFLLCGNELQIFLQILFVSDLWSLFIFYLSFPPPFQVSVEVYSPHSNAIHKH